MRRVEGVNGSYVGPDDARSGARNGDRFFILSDEGALVHVKWTTGSLRDQYGTVFARHVVADRMIEAPYDEFAFEAGRAVPNGMGLNVAALHTAGGDVALIEAMEAEGHLDQLRYACVEAATMVRQAIASDPSWTMVREALGATSNDVERSAIIAAFIAAIESGDDTAEEDGEPC